MLRLIYLKLVMARFFLAFVAVVLIASPVTARPSVTDVRLGAHSDKTRFVLELTEAPAYRAFTLPDPFRVVIDLPALDWRLGSQRVVEGGGLVQAVRYGLFAPGTSRVVLDVKGPVDFKQVFALPPENGYGYRLVLDMVPISREDYFARSRTPLVSSTPLPRTQQAAFPQAPPQPQGDTRPVIVIDAGHGGVDPGAIGRSGIHEKSLVLVYAKEMKRQMANDPGGRRLPAPARPDGLRTGDQCRPVRFAACQFSQEAQPEGGIGLYPV